MIAFTLNGAPASTDAAPFAPLSDTLREGLGLTGTKVGCEAGDCGACTVLIDGAQACACLVPTAQAEGASITTIEMQSGEAGALLARLRAAFMAHGAAQCGICTPGMIMAAADLLLREAAPDAQGVRDAIGGVLCRCTGYQKIVEAILAAASGFAPVEQEAAAGEAVGASIARLDGWPKVLGTERYGADGAPADALWLRVVRSPHASARFTLGDVEAARARLGLAAILTSADVPGLNAFGIMPALKDQPVLADGFVRYRGEAVLALVGDRAAVEAVRDAELPIAWQPQPALIGTAAARTAGAPLLHAHAPGNILVQGRLARGNPDAAHATAAATAEGHFTTAFVEHAYIEPEAGHAIPREDGMDIIACTQAPYMDREEVARVLGTPEDSVRIIPSACGGGFGGKLDVSVQPLLAIAARRVNRPVRVTYSRTESMASSTKRHPAQLHARMSADTEGKFLAYSLEGDFNTGAYASWGPTVANRVPVHAAGPYRVPHVRAHARAIHTNEPPSGAFRGFGVPQAAIATESLVDDLALQLGMDRWEIRRRNALTRGDATHSGQVLHASAGLPECLDALKADWDAMLAKVAAHNAENPRHRLGAGIACMWYGCGNTSMSNPSRIRATLARDGRLTLWNGAVDIGQGSTTVIAQIFADALGLPVAALHIVTGDTALTHDAGKTSASRQTFVSGRAAMQAGQVLRAQILQLANAGDDARFSLTGTTLTITDSAGAARGIDLATLPADLDAEGRYDPPTTALDAMARASPTPPTASLRRSQQVEVDVALGTIKVRTSSPRRMSAATINPTLVEGQIHGGIAQGLVWR
jgi:aldehyde oxidoreductase